MTDLIVELQKTSLEDIAKEIHDAEIAVSLKALEVDSGKNYAIFDRDDSFPETGITIFPKPAIPPIGATKICDGSLVIASVEMEVEAFRLAADEVEEEEPVADEEVPVDRPDGMEEMVGPADEPPAVRMTGPADEPPGMNGFEDEH